MRGKGIENTEKLSNWGNDNLCVTWSVQRIKLISWQNKGHLAAGCRLLFTKLIDAGTFNSHSMMVFDSVELILHVASRLINKLSSFNRHVTRSARTIVPDSVATSCGQRCCDESPWNVIWMILILISGNWVNNRSSLSETVCMWERWRWASCYRTLLATKISTNFHKNFKFRCSCV